MRKALAIVSSLFGLWLCLPAVGAERVDVEPLVAELRLVGPKGQGHARAIAAWKSLARTDAEQLPAVLAGMDGAEELAENWIRAAAEAIADRALAAGQELPQPELEQFIADTSHSPRARRLAYELIIRVDTSAKMRIIPGLLDDPSLELRRDAVAMRLDRADGIAKEDPAQAARLYEEALSAARDVDQIQAAAKQLRGLGGELDLSRHFGFIRSWKLIGPFDNSGTKSFDAVYPPETEIDLAATYAGKSGEKVAWIEHRTDDEYGIVDLNKAIGKHNGAAAYAWCEFTSDDEREAELRLGCINANKVWLNGELLTANHVYHANTEIDQYVGRGRLQKGKNEILVKVCQNEQTEDWAQRWQFQLRVCDERGTAMLSTDRP